METPLGHILSAQICVENLKFDFFCIGSTNVHATLVQKIANSRRRKIEVGTLMPKFSPNLHLIQTMTLFLNSNIYEVTFLHMTLWFYNTSKPISRTQFTQYLSDHFGQNVMHFCPFPGQTSRSRDLPLYCDPPRREHHPLYHRVISPLKL